MIKLAIFDLDDTLTVGPTIWELIHKENGTWETFGIKYWKDFCGGKFGYNKFIKLDVGCWKGLSLIRVKKAISRTKYSKGLRETFREFKKSGIKIAIVSSSLETFASHVAKKFGIDHVHANVLEVRNGKLTGRIRLDVPGLSKGRLIRHLKRKLKLKKSEVLAVGDSTFDIPMFKEAGTSVSFNDAPKKVKRLVNYVIPKNNLRKLTSMVKAT